MLEIKDLVESFSKLPGIGKKSAARITYHLIDNKEKGSDLSRVIKEVLANIQDCSICGNYTINDPCPICSDQTRDDSIMCVVEESGDLEAIEMTGGYTGQYHILKGSLNPLDGVTPDKLRIKELLKRVQDGEFKEILIATNPTIEGESTFLYINNLLKDFNIKVSRLATGIPMGGSLEYADKLTLSKALQSKLYV